MTLDVILSTLHSEIQESRFSEANGIRALVTGALWRSQQVRFRSRVRSPHRLTALSLSLSGHHEPPDSHHGVCVRSQMRSTPNDYL